MPVPATRLDRDGERDTDGDTQVPHKASVMSSARRTETPARYTDQRFLDRALAPPIALDDRRLKGLLAKLRYPQLHCIHPV